MVTLINLPALTPKVKRSFRELRQLANPFRTEDFFRGFDREIYINIVLLLFLMVPSMIACILISNPYDYRTLVAIFLVVFLVVLFFGNYDTNLLILFGLFIFAGYFQYFTAANYPFSKAFRLSLICYLIAIVIPVVAGIIIFNFGQSLVKKEIPIGEAYAVTFYSSVPALLGGMFAASTWTFVLHLIFISFSCYFIYSAFKARYEFEVVLPFFLITILATSIVSMLLFVISTSLAGIPQQYF
ncbi:MAG: hypothetical protein KAU03_07105 [Candidatus Altiarchaeales archaeon]|nr:hypothetical protein [Candidatus Altiarchaeales archaeon]